MEILGTESGIHITQVKLELYPGGGRHGEGGRETAVVGPKSCLTYLWDSQKYWGLTTAAFVFPSLEVAPS